MRTGKNIERVAGVLEGLPDAVNIPAVAMEGKAFGSKKQSTPSPHLLSVCGDKSVAPLWISEDSLRPLTFRRTSRASTQTP